MYILDTDHITLLARGKGVRSPESDDGAVAMCPTQEPGIRSWMLCGILLLPGCGPEAGPPGRPPPPVAPPASGPARDGQPVLRLDERYLRAIHFDAIGVSIPIEQPGWYLRSDGFVSDMEAHRVELLAELGLRPDTIPPLNATHNGYAAGLGFPPPGFAGGVRCVVIWSRKDADPRITRVRLEHEKLHALARLNRPAMKSLSGAIREKGFDVDVGALDEELAASVVEILSLHLQGVELDKISGSENTVKARDLLRRSRTAPTRPP